MDRWEREAAGFIAAYLIMANAAEYLDGVDQILDEYDRDLLSTTAALFRVRKLREAMTRSNAKLGELTRDEGCPPSESGDLFLPWTPS